MSAQAEYTMTLQGLYEAVGKLDHLHVAKRSELRSAIKTFGKACRGEDRSNGGFPQ